EEAILDKLVPLLAEHETLRNSVAELTDEQIAADLDARGIKDPAIREKLFPVLQPMLNRAERLDFLGLMARPEGAGDSGSPLTRRIGATMPPGKLPGAGDPRLEARKTQLISNRAAELQRDTPGLTTATAFIAAQRAIESELSTGALSLK